MPEHTESTAAALQLSSTNHCCSHSTQLGQQGSAACFTMNTKPCWLHSGTHPVHLKPFFSHTASTYRPYKPEESFLHSSVFCSSYFSVLHNPGSSDPVFQSVFLTTVCSNSTLLPTNQQQALPKPPFCSLSPRAAVPGLSVSASSINRELTGSRENSNHCPYLRH